jgi:hypothetical protein
MADTVDNRARPAGIAAYSRALETRSLTPAVAEEIRTKIRGLVDDAVAAGAQRLCEGQASFGDVTVHFAAAGVDESEAVSVAVLPLPDLYTMLPRSADAYMRPDGNMQPSVLTTALDELKASLDDNFGDAVVEWGGGSIDDKEHMFALISSKPFEDIDGFRDLAPKRALAVRRATRGADLRARFST